MNNIFLNVLVAVTLITVGITGGVLASIAALKGLWKLWKKR